MIEEALQGKKVGESVVVKMQPDDAFGEYDAELVQIEPRKSFPKELQIGMQFEGAPEDGDEDDILIYRVTEIADDKVVLDGNHPLAGMALVFTCTVTGVRPANAERSRTVMCTATTDARTTTTDPEVLTTDTEAQTAPLPVGLQADGAPSGWR